MSRRWEFGLPLAAAAVGTLIVGLAWVTTSAWQQRHVLFLEGQQLRLAHRIERLFRENGPRDAEKLLRQVLADSASDARGIVLLAADGQEQLRVGLIEGEPTLEANLFVGMNWAFAPDASVPMAPSGRGRGPIRHACEKLDIAAIRL